MTKNTPVVSEIQIPVRRTTTTVVEEFVEVEDLADDRDPDDDRDDDRPSPKRRGSR